jgi:hypothetical protein
MHSGPFWSAVLTETRTIPVTLADYFGYAIVIAEFFAESVEAAIKNRTSDPTTTWSV